MSDANDLLRVRNLRVGFDTDDGQVVAVDGVSFDIPAGKTVGLVGESGCGKTVTSMAVLRLLQQPAGRILQGEILFGKEDLVKAPLERLYQVRGGEISVAFQEPMTALNPVWKVGRQISEVLRRHKKLPQAEADRRTIDLLKKVGIPAPEQRVNDYPHQLSGGMRQRVMIAMALSCDPRLLIADEPTTALDVTVQAQILQLIQDLQKENGMSVLLITHDLGVIAEMCDEVAVMYAGRIVEKAPVGLIFSSPTHAYTRGLLQSIPRLDHPPKTRLSTIPGQVPALRNLNEGCRFWERSGLEHTQKMKDHRPPLAEVAPGHWVEACPMCGTVPPT